MSGRRLPDTTVIWIRLQSPSDLSHTTTDLTPVFGLIDNEVSRSFRVGVTPVSQTTVTPGPTVTPGVVLVSRGPQKVHRPLGLCGIGSVT